MDIQPRPRCYSFAPLPGFASDHVAWLVAGLTEVTERHFDLVQRLPAHVLDERLGEAPSSINQITAHLGWGDANWLGALRAESMPTPSPLDRELQEPPSPFALEETIAACLSVRHAGLEFLRNVSDPHQPTSWRDEGKLTVHGVLMHLIWHWTYHDGQCGEIALALGHSHPWTFEQHVGRVSAQMQ
jgi:uncharacterized damage-inducible protein DinB